jgi:carbonic anhydrase
MPLNRRGFIAGLMTCPICAGLAKAEGAAQWVYEGKDGAADWGRLDKKFEACGVGSEQSPVDLNRPIVADVGPLRIEWNTEAFEIENNGHTIEAEGHDMGGILLDGKAFQLKQFHFHHPSEHALGGERTAMEAHFVHANEAGKLAVVGVLMKAGTRNDDFAAIMAAAPRAEGKNTLAAPLDPAGLLPANNRRYRYEGSLTTPPCSEIVDWNVFEEPITVAAADIEIFKSIFPMNARRCKRWAAGFCSRAEKKFLYPEEAAGYDDSAAQSLVFLPMVRDAALLTVRG